MTLFLFFFFSTLVSSQERNQIISGIVTDGKLPIESVNVTISGTKLGTTTDQNGKYDIKSKPSDIIEFSFVGKQSFQVIIEDVTTILNIVLSPDYEELDEVVVTKRKPTTRKDLAKNYYGNPTVINSSVGYLSPELVGYDLRVVDGKDLNTSSFDILDAIAEQLPGVTVYTNPNGAIGRFLFVRSAGAFRGARSAVFEVDGNLFTDAPIWLDIESVLRIGIIPPQQALIKFGKIASGGIVIINTNGVKHGIREEDGRPYDIAKLRNNIFNDDALSTDEVIKYGSTYLRDLYQSNSIRQAEQVFEDNRMKLQNSPYFLIDSYAYFMKKNHFQFAEKIAIEGKKTVEGNPLLLKVWAYYFDAYNQEKDAKKLYEQIFNLRPNYVQSYRDLAYSYHRYGNLKKSASIYARYHYLRDKGLLNIVDSLEMNTIIERESDNLVVLNANKLLSGGTFLNRPEEFESFNGIRLVFEWNDSEAEFDLQFVNPQKHYHSWEHTMIANPERINDEKMKGYSTQEFLIDDSLPGKWMVNVNYKGNKRLEPTYLKTTVYYNYGHKKQSKVIKVFKLMLKGVNHELFYFINSNGLSMN